MDFVPLRREITAAYSEGDVRSVTMHDGSTVRFRKLTQDYDPTDREAAYQAVREAQGRGEVVTGLLYIDEKTADMHEQNRTIGQALAAQPYDRLCPGEDALQALMDEYR